MMLKTCVKVSIHVGTSICIEFKVPILQQSEHATYLIPKRILQEPTTMPLPTPTHTV